MPVTPVRTPSWSGEPRVRTCWSARRPSPQPAEDDPARRGHLSLEETLEHARSAEVGRLLVTHYPSSLRAAMEARIARGAEPATVARPGLSVERRRRRTRPRLSGSAGPRPGRPSR